MAELNSGGGGGGHKGGKIRSKKQSARVDMTPMVDLMFLLITFFMLTTTLAKPKAMDLAMPDKDEKLKDNDLKIADFRSMNILLGADNKLEWYMGQPDKPLGSPEVEKYGKDGIRKVIIEQNKKILAQTGDPKKGLIVLIKASDQSIYRNLVDILDEMKITNTQQYAISDITDPDIQLLKRDGLYK